MNDTSACNHAATTSCLDGDDKTVVPTVDKLNTVAILLVLAAADLSAAATATAAATTTAATASCHHSRKAVG